MFYSGGDRTDLVKTLQTMLNQLGFTDNAGNALDVDGDFGEETEQAVKNFQQDSKSDDFEGNSLKVDGEVGPKTSDALNRKLVGIFYRRIDTPIELTDGQPLITVTADQLRNGLDIEPGDQDGMSLVIAGEVPKLHMTTESEVEVQDGFLQEDKHFTASETCLIVIGTATGQIETSEAST